MSPFLFFLVSYWFGSIPVVFAIVVDSIAPLGVVLIVVGAVRESSYRRRRDHPQSRSN